MLSKFHTRLWRLSCLPKPLSSSLTRLQIRNFPRRVTQVKQGQPETFAEIKINKEEKSFKQSLKEDEPIDEFLDSALYQYFTYFLIFRSTPVVHDTSEGYFDKKKRPEDEIALDNMTMYNIGRFQTITL